MLIDEMMSPMSGNHICTIHEPSATMLTLACRNEIHIGEAEVRCERSD